MTPIIIANATPLIDKKPVLMTRPLHPQDNIAARIIRSLVEEKLILLFTKDSNPVTAINPYAIIEIPAKTALGRFAKNYVNGATNPKNISVIAVLKVTLELATLLIAIVPVYSE